MFHVKWRRQRGAAAIEFAFLFPLFFVVFYAIASYGIVFTLEQTLTAAAMEGARAAVAVDPVAFANSDAYEAQVQAVARNRVGAVFAGWPATVRGKVLGAGNSAVDVAVQPTATPLGQAVIVTVQYPNYTSAPIVPILNFPGFGSVPRVPQNLVATANVQLP